MKTTVEDRIVQLRFDNDQFEKGAEQSLRTLDKLEGVLDKLGEGGLDKLGSALDTLQNRFSTLGIVGMAALENITNSVMRLATNLLTAIPNQIISGGKTRALNIEQAKFQLKGLGVAWADVEDDIDHAVKGTAYGLDEAAIVASQLAASGVNYKNLEGQISDMGQILRGISGVAAMTNSTYGEIGHIFTGIAGTGHVMTQDLRMLEGRGLNVAAKLAEVLNQASGSAQYTEESIREMVSKGQVDFLTFARAMDVAFGEHATAANETYTGSLSNMKAALSRIGADFATPTFTALRDIQNALRVVFDNVRKITRPFAEGAYTKWLENTTVKVVNLVNRISDGIAKIKATGDALYNSLFNPIRKITELIEPGKLREVTVINDKIAARLKNIKDGLTGIKLVFQNIHDIFTVAKFAFKSFMESHGFPGLVSGLDTALEAFGNFGRKMQQIGRLFKWFYKVGESGALKLDNVLKDNVIFSLKKKGYIDNDAQERFHALKQIFYDLFITIQRVGQNAGRIFKAAFGIIKTVINDVFGVIKVFFPSLGSFSDFFHKLCSYVISASDALAGFAEKVSQLIQDHQILSTIAVLVKSIFTFVKDAIQATGEFLGQLIGLKEGETLLSRFGYIFTNLGETIHNACKYIKDSLMNVFGNGEGAGNTITKVIGGIITAFLAWRKVEKTKWKMDRNQRTWDLLTKGLFDAAHDLANLPDKIATVLSRTSGALRAFSDNLNAKSLKEIGKAILYLAAGMWIMASVDADRLVISLAAVATVLVLLIGAMGVLITFMDTGASRARKVTSLVTQQTTKWGKFKDGVKNFGTTLKNFFRGLTVGINRLLTAGSILALSMSLAALAGSVILLAIAAKIFATMNWGELAKGLVGIVVTLGLVVAAVWALSKMGGFGIGLVGLAGSLLALGVAIALLTASLYVLNKIPFDDLVRRLLIIVLGIAAMVSALLVVTSFAKVASTGMIVGAVSMLILAAAVIVLAVALVVLSQIPWDVLLVDITLLCLALLAFAGILILLSGTMGWSLAAAGALLILSVAIIAIAVALAFMSQFNMKKMAQSAAVLGLALLAFVGVLILLSGVAPEVAIVAGALLLFGIALIAISAALLISSVALVALAIALQMMPTGARIKDIAKGLGSLGRNMLWLGAGGAFSSLGVKAFEGLVPLATGLALMENLDFDKLGPGLKAVGKALIWLGLGGILMGLGGLLGSGATVVMLSALGKALPDLAKGYSAFAGMAPETIENTGKALGKSVGALFGLQFSTFRDGVPVLKEIGEALPSLAKGFAAFTDVDRNMIKMTGQALLVGVGSIFELQFATFRDGVPVLVELSSALPMLAMGFQSFAGMEPETIQKTGQALGKAVGAIFGLEFATFRDGVPVLAELSTALPPLSMGFSTFNGMDPETITSTGMALKKAVGAIFGLEFATFKDGVPVLGELTTVLPGLASGFGAFVGIDPELIANTGVALKKAIGGLFTLQFSTFTDGTQTLLNLGMALPVLAQGFQAFAGMDPEWVQNLAVGLSNGIKALTGNIFTKMFEGDVDFAYLAAGIRNLAFAVAMIPVDAEMRLTGIATGLQVVMTVSMMTLEQVTINLSMIYMNTEMTVMMMVALIQTSCENIYLALSEMAMNTDILIVESLMTIEMNVSTSLFNIETTISSCLYNIQVYIQQTMFMMVAMVQQGMMLAVSAVMSAYPAMYQAGAYVGRGLADGLMSQLSAVRAAAQALADAAASATQQALDINSPSRVFQRLGEFTSMGLVQGILSGEGDVESTITTIIDPILAAIGALMDSNMDISPRITPVVDLSDAEAMSGQLSTMFNGIGTYAVDAANRISSAEYGNGSGNGFSSNSVGDTISPTINVYAQPGQDVNEIAKAVEQRLVRLNKQQRLGALT